MNQQKNAPDIVAELLKSSASLDKSEAKLAREAFLLRVDQATFRAPARPHAYWLVPLAAAAAILLGIFFWPASELRYEVSGAEDDGGYIRAQGTEYAKVEFSDRTQLSAAPGSRLRILETQENGARVSVEDGDLSVHVTHTSTSAWTFEAGPFQVRVTGTRFLLDWDPKTEQLGVVLLEGSVEVEGYDGSGPVAVRAGQRFLGDARARTMHVSSAPLKTKNEEELPALPKERESDAPLEGDDSKPGDVGISKPSKGSSSASWSTLVSRGKFAEVVKAANQQGVANCLANCNAPDLGALADAARYTGQGELASKSLLSLRERFTGTTKVRAAFLLGRLYEGQGAHGTARTWYETCLRESPSGEFAGESLAGKMRALLSVGGKTAAQPVAQEYLRRFPQGVHASAAQKLIQP